MYMNLVFVDILRIHYLEAESDIHIVSISNSLHIMKTYPCNKQIFEL